MFGDCEQIGWTLSYQIHLSWIGPIYNLANGHFCCDPADTHESQYMNTTRKIQTGHYIIRENKEIHSSTK